jgi:hypothetical protein
MKWGMRVHAASGRLHNKGASWGDNRRHSDLNVHNCLANGWEEFLVLQVAWEFAALAQQVGLLAITTQWSKCMPNTQYPCLALLVAQHRYSHVCTQHTSWVVIK